MSVAAAAGAARAPSRMDELVAAIKARRGLANLDDAFVRERAERVLRSDGRIRKKLDASRDFAQFSRSREHEALLKAVRKELRAVYGVFQQREREGLLEEYERTRDGALLDEIMRAHTSTRERLAHYPEICAQLASRIPAPKTLVDLGCGLNPLAYLHFKDAGWSPYVVASDISSADMAFLERCFAAAGIPGETHALDLTKDREALMALRGDVALLLKLLDSLEETRRHVSYDVLSAIAAPWIVVSFPTRSLGGGRRISTKGRSWFERLLRRLAFSWETFEVENEFFYVCRKEGASDGKAARARKGA